MINVDRSLPEPPCLSAEREKARGDYKCGEVLPYLSEIFYNKCYLCEFKNPPSINVEHLEPHKGDRALKFDWDNLFLSCYHCNNTKLAKPEYDHILNCAKPEDRVEEWIKYESRPFPSEKVRITALKDDERTVSTVRLLDSVYNGKTRLKRLESKNIRKQLLNELLDFQKCLLRYDDDDAEEDEKNLYLEKVRKHLRRSSAFCAFKRWIIRKNDTLNMKFARFMV